MMRTCTSIPVLSRYNNPVHPKRHLPHPSPPPSTPPDPPSHHPSAPQTITTPISPSRPHLQPVVQPEDLIDDVVGRPPIGDELEHLAEVDRVVPPDADRSRDKDDDGLPPGGGLDIHGLDLMLERAGPLELGQDVDRADGGGASLECHMRVGGLRWRGLRGVGIAERRG